jgi:uncharacterized membrane protein
MSALVILILAATTFAASHLLLSHPLRAPLVARIGEQLFLGLYSLIAAGALVWLILAFDAVPPSAPLWRVNDGTWIGATLVMLLASVLLAGSLFRNPALVSPGAPGALPTRARGVFAITRHPMNWSFTLWGLCHIAVYPGAANFILCGMIVVLALVGSALQDAKKRALQAERWLTWQAMTSFWPFAAAISGRARLRGFGWIAPSLGVLIWLVATWAHNPIAHVAAGPWRWITPA